MVGVEVGLRELYTYLNVHNQKNSVRVFANDNNVINILNKGQQFNNKTAVKRECVVYSFSIQ